MTIKQKKSFFVLLILFLLFALSTCQILQEECERNNTGILSVENKSKTGKAYKIIIDGISYGILGPGDTKEWTVSAGPHLLEIRFADTDKPACNPSMPTITKCQKFSISCDG